MADTVDKGPVALMGHCKTTYEAMLATAQLYETDEGTKVVWQGMLTHLITGELRLSTPYYSAVLSALKRMGCIAQLKRGGGSTPSQWLLLREPTEELFETTVDKKTGSKVRASQYEVLEGQVKDLNRRLSMVETVIRKLIEEEVRDARAHVVDEE